MCMRIPLALLAALALAAAGCGGGDDKPAEKKPSGSVDQAFVVRLTAHTDVSRRLAAEGAKRAKDPALRKLARRMVTAREGEQQTLRGLQQRLGGSRGGRDPLGVTPQQATETLQPDALRDAKPFDRTFLNLMVQHHQGALNLIQAERSKGKDPAVKAFADQLGVTRAGELNQLSDLLAKAR